MYAFSIENFLRTAEEVDKIFSLLSNRATEIAEGPMEAKARVRLIGNRSLIEPERLAQITKIEEESDTPEKTHTVNICVAYTSRDEIAHSIREVARLRQSEEVSRDGIDSALLEREMYFGPGTTPLDLLVRTSGHTRLSDFLLWQCTLHCSIQFVQTLWPEFWLFEFCWILLSWSFTRHHNKKRFSLSPNKLCQESVDLRQLPPCPPLVSVSD